MLQKSKTQATNSSSILLKKKPQQNKLEKGNMLLIEKDGVFLAF